MHAPTSCEPCAQALEIATQQEHPDLPNELRTVLERLERLRAETRAQRTPRDAGRAGGLQDTEMAGTGDSAAGASQQRPPGGAQQSLVRQEDAERARDRADDEQMGRGPQAATAVGQSGGAGAPQLDWPALGMALAPDAVEMRREVEMQEAPEATAEQLLAEHMAAQDAGAGAAASGHAAAQAGMEQEEEFDLDLGFDEVGDGA